MKGLSLLILYRASVTLVSDRKAIRVCWPAKNKVLITNNLQEFALIRGVGSTFSREGDYHLYWTQRQSTKKQRNNIRNFHPKIETTIAFLGFRN